MKACDRGLITLLGKWRHRMKWSDYQSSPLVWLGGSSPPLKFRKVFLAIELTFPRNWTGDVNKTCPFPPDFYQIMLDFVKNYS